MKLQKLTVQPKAAHAVISMPHFGDVISEDGDVVIANDEEGDWQVIDDVPHKMPIIDLYGNKNLLKRRDQTCKVIYSSLGRTSNRVIVTEALYLAAENCQRELYQGAFRDWESRSDVFSEKAVELISKIVGTDFYSNKWFGNVTRPATANYSTNKINGIWKYVADYVDSGLIPSTQTLDLGAADVNFTDQDAYDALVAMINAQDDIMDNLDDDMKAFHINKKWARKVWRYLVSIGEATPSAKAEMNLNFSVEGIKVKVKKWDPIINEVNGGAGNAGILTMDGNFLYATDTAYGGGPDSKGPALQVWYDQTDDVTRWKYDFKAGFEIGAPQHSVVAASTGLLAKL